MKCEKCGREFHSSSHVCPACGAAYSRGEAGPAGTPAEGRGEKHRRSRRVRRRGNAYYFKRRVVNWAWVRVISALLLMSALVGGYFYLKTSDNGKVILARHGRKADAKAYWTVGEENFDRGYISKAIELFELAEKEETDKSVLPLRLFTLAEAYEAMGEAEKAKEAYLRITEIAKDDMELTDPRDKGDGKDKSMSLLLPRKVRAKAYRNAIRLLNQQGYPALAADMMKTAFESTQEDSFIKERSGIVPKAPTATLTGGRHMLNQTVSFVSEQGYDIYYTDDDADLPEGGKLFTEPLLLTEGGYFFRAVCVADKLISDEMAVKYTIALPIPVAPRSNVQPGAYNHPFGVKLRNVGDDKDVRMFYTVDGSKPTENSPEFTGESIRIPAGRVTLRAIAVNHYGKSSNELVMEYKVKGRTAKRFQASESMGKLTLLKTTKDEFISFFGAPEREEDWADGTVKTPGARLLYPWGEALFTRGHEGVVLCGFKTDSTALSGPRKTSVGMSMADVIACYSDYGQPADLTGDRGLYCDYQSGYGAFISSDGSDRNGKIEYLHLEKGTANQGTTTLTYRVENGAVTGVEVLYSDQLHPILR